MGREIWGKVRRETDRVRPMGRGETRCNDSENMRREKIKGREKVKELTVRERRCHFFVFCFLFPWLERLQNKIIFKL